MKLNEAINIAKEYYENREVPKTVTEYMSDYPKGLSRTMLKSKLGITAGQFLKHIGSSYEEMESTESKLIALCQKRKHTILSSTNNLRSKDKVMLRCSEGHEFSTYWASYSISDTGCRICAGNDSLSTRHFDLVDRAEDLGVCIVALPEGNQLSKITLKCLSCEETYSCMVGRFLTPKSDKEGTCPNCRNTDTRVSYKGIVFGSQFERECYKLLEHLKPMTQVRYSKYFDTARQWSCDFVIGDTWIEVSSYRESSQGYTSYISNIENKKALVESEGKRFVYLSSLREVQDFIDKI